MLEALHLLLYLLFSAFRREKYIVGILELVFPFLLHPVETRTFVLLVIAKCFYQLVIRVGAGVFKFDFAGVQIFGSEKSKILKSFQAQQRGMERAIEVKDSFVNLEF